MDGECDRQTDTSRLQSNQTTLSIDYSFLFTHADASMCDPVRMIKPKRLKVQSPNLAHRWSIDHVTIPSPNLPLILGQKVKGQDHRVTKCKSIAASCYWNSHALDRAWLFLYPPSYSRTRLGDRMAGVSYAPLSSAPLVLKVIANLRRCQPQTDALGEI